MGGQREGPQGVVGVVCASGRKPAGPPPKPRGGLLDRVRTQDHRFYVRLGRLQVGLGVTFQLGDFLPPLGDTLHNLALDGQRGDRNGESLEFL